MTQKESKRVVQLVRPPVNARYRLIITNTTDNSFRVLEGTYAELDKYEPSDDEMTYLVRDRRNHVD